MLLLKVVRLKSLIWFAYIIIFVLYLASSILTQLDTRGKEMVVFIATMLTLVGMSVGTVLSTTSFLALASMMSPALVKVFFVGRGLSGIVPVVFNLGSNAVFSPMDAALFTFGTVTGIMAVSLVVLYLFTVNKYVAPFIATSNNLTRRSKHLETKKSASMVALMPKAAKLGFVCLIQQAMLFTIYPGLMSLLKQSQGGGMDEKYFLLIHVFSVFGVGDICGRLSAQFIKFPGKGSILYFTLATGGLAMLLIMCNIQPRTIPVWFTADWCPALIFFIFSMTGGHCLSLSYSYAPSVVDNELDKAVVATIHHCCSFGGQVLGIGLSYLTQYLINL